MTEILDQKEDLSTPVELSKNWKDLQIILIILLVLGGVACLVYGISIEVELHNRPFAIPFGTIQEIRIASILIIAPIGMIFSGITLILNKHFAWIGAISSGLFIAMISAFIAYIANDNSSWVIYIVSIFSLAFSIVLFAKPYRDYYQFKWVNIVFIIGIPAGLLAFSFLH